MPKKTFYVKDQDQNLIERIKEVFPNKSFSEILANLMKEKLNELKKNDSLTVDQKIEKIAEVQGIEKSYLEDQSEAYIEGRYESLQENYDFERDRSEGLGQREDLEQLKTARKELYEGDGNLDEEVQKLVEDEGLSEAEALKRLRKNLYEGE